MKRCNAMVDAGRRKFLTGAGIVAGGAAASAVPVSDTKAAPAPARVIYPSNRLANVRDLKINEPLPVSYPDKVPRSSSSRVTRCSQSLWAMFA
jgi:arsenite oxidase small subunit